jgi:hypothetical protein
MRVLFYKGPETWAGKLIRLWTLSPYSHCELLFKSGVRFRVSPEEGAQFYRSCESPGWDMSRWDCIEVPDAQEPAIRDFCDFEVGCAEEHSA